MPVQINPMPVCGSPATGANLQNGSTQRPRQQALEYCSVNTQQILDSLNVSEGAHLLL